MERFSKILVVLALSATACGSNGGTNTTPPADSGTPTDTQTVNDTGTVTDTGTTTDRGPATDTSTTTDRPVTTTDSGMSYGSCGMAAVGCLCTAGMDATAQQRCFTSNMSCGQCFSDAIASCCPAQVMAVQTCATTHMCMDAACAQMQCATEYAAIQTCFQGAQMTNAACRTALSGCFGAFPIACGG